MPVSEKKKASNAKWDSANMATIGCRIKKTQAEAFKVYCKSQGKTSNTVLKDYVLKCLDPRKESEFEADATAIKDRTKQDTEGPQEAAEQSIPPQAPEPLQDGTLVLVERGPVALNNGEIKTLFKAPETEREYYVEPVISDDEWDDLQRAKDASPDDPDELPF